jgi:hypothetical protein
MIGGPTMQHIEISYAFLDETNNLGIHNRAVVNDSAKQIYARALAIYGSDISVTAVQKRSAPG